jgi:hypothetical protein
MDWLLQFNVILEITVMLIDMWLPPETRELKHGGHFMHVVGNFARGSQYRQGALEQP